VVRKVETIQSQGELEAKQVRISELENHLERYQATLDAQLGLLPAAKENPRSDSDDNPQTVSVSVE
jgi:hypothetical protein